MRQGRVLFLDEEDITRFSHDRKFKQLTSMNINHRILPDGVKTLDDADVVLLKRGNKVKFLKCRYFGLNNETLKLKEE